MGPYSGPGRPYPTDFARQGQFARPGQPARPSQFAQRPRLSWPERANQPQQFGVPAQFSRSEPAPRPQPAAPAQQTDRPKPNARPRHERFGALGVASDYLIRTASILGILAVLGLASAVDGQQTPTTGTAASASAHAGVQAGKH